MACRIYRVLFGASDQTIVLDKNSAAAKSITQGTGQSPTISMLDAMANEAIRDVDEGVKSFSYLVSQHDLDSASNRLAEAFASGEYLARIRTLPRKEKQPVATFVRDSNQLIAAMESRDFKTAGTLIVKLKQSANDFDGIKAQSKIDEAGIAANLLIDKAKMASLQGKGEDAATDLEKARSIWPTNPALSEFRGLFERGGLQATSLKELETLLNQKNYRLILADQAKYSAAVNGLPELEQKLAEVLSKVRQLDLAITQSDQLADAGDPHGAWEILQKASAEAPADNEINRRLATLSGRASDLAGSIGKAQRLEKTGEFGPALTWFLKARATYPMSQLAREGIDRLSASIMRQSDPLHPAPALAQTPAPTVQETPPPPAPAKPQTQNQQAAVKP
jgi:tetratricopeptide (TPR) repeat protein